jgi:transposase
MTGEVFRAYVEQMLAPAVREALQAAGANVLYLPPYSPDLNPIEQLFAKLNAMLRSAAARTNDALWAIVGAALGAFPETECRIISPTAGTSSSAPRSGLITNS